VSDYENQGEYYYVFPLTRRARKAVTSRICPEGYMCLNTEALMLEYVNVLAKRKVDFSEIKVICGDHIVLQTVGIRVSDKE